MGPHVSLQGAIVARSPVHESATAILSAGEEKVANKVESPA